MDKVFGDALGPGDAFKIKVEGSVYIVNERRLGANIVCRHSEEEPLLGTIFRNKEYYRLGPSEIEAHTTHPGFIRRKEA